MRTISAGWSSWGPTPQLRTFTEALHINHHHHELYLLNGCHDDWVNVTGAGLQTSLLCVMIQGVMKGWIAFVVIVPKNISLVILPPTILSFVIYFIQNLIRRLPAGNTCWKQCCSQLWKTLNYVDTLIASLRRSACSGIVQPSLNKMHSHILVLQIVS